MKTNDKQKSVPRIAGRGLVLVGLVAAVLALAASSFAQTSAAAAPKVVDAKATQPSANSPTAKAAKAPRGMGEGIQIHGWWTIEIRNRDGSVAKHVEFENALVSDGPAILAGLLSGNMVAGSWELAVAGETVGSTGVTQSTSPCSAGTDCVMETAGSGLANGSGCTAAPGVANPQPSCYATLAPSLTGAQTADFSSSSLTLSGQAYADTSTSISSVQSLISQCGISPTALASANTFSPSACYAAGSLIVPFSEYDFAPPNTPSTACNGAGQPLCSIPVQAGQVIAAFVTFSFSSPSGDGQSATPALAHPHPILRAPVSTKLPAPTPVTQ